MKINFDRRLFNPLYWHIVDAMNNEDIRYIYIMGGSSSGKSFGIGQAITNDTIQNQDNHLCMRKFSVDINDSIYSDMQTIGQQLNKFTNNFEFTQHRIKIADARIRFRGLDKSQKIQGISSYKRVYLDEITHFNYDDFKQIRKRLRGRSGQQILASWNPISVNHWINKEVIKVEDWIDLPTQLPNNPYSKLYSDGEINENSYKRINKKGNAILIKTTYRDNWWVVGHPSGGDYGYYDKHVIEEFEHDKIHNPVDYDIYANGNWGIVTERLAFKPSEWTIIDEIPEGAKRIPTGLDFGWNPDPLACTDYYIKDNYLIWDELAYDREMHNTKQYDEEGELTGYSLEQRLEELNFDKSNLIVAECTEPKSISNIRIAGFNIWAVKKRGVIEGVKLLKEYHHLITRKSKGVIYEFENYQKMIDKDGNILNEYMDKDNHHMDNARYVQFMKGRMW